jgi:putative PIN family toxin of toxin-antitoxin system
MDTSAVIDTNVVLDWLVFRDASVDALAQLVTERRLRWLVSPDMRRELELVLERNALARWNVKRDDVLDMWDRWSLPAPEVGSLPVRGHVRCSDPDDQKFIDLAIACQARWLFTRDRALLDLASPSRAFGVEVVTPRAYLALRAQTEGHA